ncbi:MAG: SGNH/GDSL hydrolase family protein [Deltaproteobacteria bacterium]|nr:SGNH/GDSL hydrolase family protein [Deltaproteobacteria bacterium]
MPARLPGQGGTVRFEPPHPGAAVRRRRGPAASTRAWLARAGYAVAWAAGLVAIPELGLRLARPPRAEPPGVESRLRALFEPARDDAVGWQLAAGAHVDVEQTWGIAINESGYRGPFHSRESFADARRIAVLGDEQAFGQDRPYEESFGGALERELRARPGGPWQVLSFAVPGYDTRAEIAHWRRDVAAFRPKLVVLGYAANDLVAPRQLEPPDLLDRLLLARLVRRALDRGELPSWREPGAALDRAVARAFDPGSATWRANRELLIDFAGEVCRAEARLVIVVLPELFGVTTHEQLERQPYQRYSAALGELASEGLAVVDPTPAFVGAGLRPTELWADGEGRRKNAVATSLIVRSVIESGALEPRHDFVPCPLRAGG